MRKQHTIEEMWETFRMQVLPKVPEKSFQFSEMKLAFCSGVIAAIAKLQELSIEYENNEEQARIIVDKIMTDYTYLCTMEFKKV